RFAYTTLFRSKVNLATGSGDLDLPVASGWSADRPALLRAQLINGGTTATEEFLLSDFDSGGYSNTLFLYPASTVNPLRFSLDGRRSESPVARKPPPVLCKDDPASGDYACEAVIELEEAIPPNRQTAFLNLMAFYSTTDYSVELQNSGETVHFSGVQPEVDSTGR